MVRVSPSIHSFRSLAISPGRNIVAKDSRKRICILTGAFAIVAMIVGRSCQGSDGIDLTIGDANTRLTLSTGL